MGTWNVENTDIILFQNYYIYEPLIHPLGAVQEHKFESRLILGQAAQHNLLLFPFLCELVADELLLGQLGLLVDLSQHLVHHTEQGTAQA